MPKGKREVVARWADRIGLTSALRSSPQRSQLIVLNYHRIGYADEAPFDAGVFSATPEAFAGQLKFLASQFEVVDLVGALRSIHGQERWRGARILVTFDDGYVDNHAIALPLLRDHGIKAVFFLATGFVGTAAIPWWDEIAHCVRSSRVRRLVLRYPSPVELDIDDGGTETTIRRVLGLFKSPSVQDGTRFVVELREAAGLTGEKPPTTRLFMSWAEAADLVRAGMGIGSHTHSHPVLSKLERGAQYDEVSRSRGIIEQRLSLRVDSLAYPVGKPDTFTPGTVSVLQEAGYQAAFSYHGGFNLAGRIDRYDVKRQSVDDGTSAARFRLQVRLAALTGRLWA